MPGGVECGSARRRSRRLGALLLAIIFFVALPITVTTAAEAQPVTLGDWMRAIFLAPDRKFDPSQKGMALPPRPVAEPLVQTSSEPAPPKEPVAQTQVPRFWVPPRSTRRKRRLVRRTT
jgi:hypothetical protein